MTHVTSQWCRKRATVIGRPLVGAPAQGGHGGSDALFGRDISRQLPFLGDGAGGLEFDDAVPVEPEVQQDLVGLFGESRCWSGLWRTDIELDGVRDEFEFTRA